MKAILICGHGSKDGTGNNAVLKHSSKVRELTGLPTYVAFHNEQSPSIAVTIDTMVSEGVDEIIVVPLFFAPGFLATKMVPRELGLEANQTEGEIVIDGKEVAVHITGVFGDHPLMAEVMQDVLGGYGFAPKDTHVILIGHGAKDSNNSKVVEFNSKFVRDLGYGVTCAYNETEAPGVEEALISALSSGAGNIVVIPMFVSPGNHSSVEIPEKLGLKDGKERTIAMDGKDVKLVYAEEIGLNPGVAEIIAERIMDY